MKDVKRTHPAKKVTNLSGKKSLNQFRNIFVGTAWRSEESNKCQMYTNMVWLMCPRGIPCQNWSGDLTYQLVRLGDFID